MKHTLFGLAVVLVLATVLAGCGGSSTTTTRATLGEMPAIALDANGDGMYSVDELAAGYAQMHEVVKVIAEYDPSRAAELDAEITALENTDPFRLDMLAVLKTSADISDAWEAARLSQ